MAAFNVTLTGGAPWGFSMAGGIDFNQPLNVSKVTSGGKAAMKGIRPGLCILQVTQCRLCNQPTNFLRLMVRMYQTCDTWTQLNMLKPAHAQANCRLCWTRELLSDHKPDRKNNLRFWQITHSSWWRFECHPGRYFNRAWHVPRTESHQNTALISKTNIRLGANQ